VWAGEEVFGGSLEYCNVLGCFGEELITIHEPRRCIHSESILFAQMSSKCNHNHRLHMASVEDDTLLMNYFLATDTI
jgi:hypothetical protein